MKHLSQLKQPVQFMDSRADKLRYVFFLPIFAACFLLFFQPFGVNNYDPTHTISPTLLIGIGTFTLSQLFILAVNEFLIEPLLFRGKNWIQLMSWAIWSLLLLSSSTFLVYNWLGGFHDWYWGSYLGFIRDVSGLALIPNSILYLFFHNRNIQARFLLMQYQNQQAAADNGLAFFESENGKDKLAVHWQQLLFVESQDNYVAIYYHQSGQILKKLIRHSLKKLEKEFAGSPLLRCHRSYIANTKLAIQAEGNTHQLKLLLRYLDEPLPVSRKYVPAIRKALQPSSNAGQTSPISGIHPSGPRILDGSLLSS